MSTYPQIRESLIEDVYNSETSNILIEDSDFNNDLCCIYFSSNGIFYPETEENYKDYVIEHNKFEWYGRRMVGVHRSIFVRDILKNFYVVGINKRYNSVERLYALLKEYSKGYRVITVGSSAGGYASLLFGSLLKAEKVYSFSGQIDLWSYFDFPNKKQLQKYRGVHDYSKYYNSTAAIESSPQTAIIYVTPSRSKEDIHQLKYLERIQRDNIYIIKVKNRQHGITILKDSFESFFSVKEEELRNIQNKEISLFEFTKKYGGGVGVFVKGNFKKYPEMIKGYIRKYTNIIKQKAKFE